MKKAIQLVLLLALAAPAFAATFFVRSDGGASRYDASLNPTGIANGTSDSACSGSTPNQNCALGDPRLAYNLGLVNGGPTNWIMVGGDTLVIRGGPYRIGPGAASGSYLYCDGGNIWNCDFAPPPSGTSGNPTRILGGCAYDGTCTGPTSYPYTTNNLTQLYAGYGADLFWFKGKQWIDVEGLELTSHNGTCSRFGAPSYPASCSASEPLSDYSPAAIDTDNTTANITLKDLYIHGFTAVAIGGPIGGPFTLNKVIMAFNAEAGWNFDDGSSTANGAGSSVSMTDVIGIGNGCTEQYPIVNTQFPAKGCWDSLSAGFGDFISGQGHSPVTQFTSFSWNRVSCIYNTKDCGLGPEALVHDLSVTNSIVYGNMGGPMKFAGDSGATVLFENNLVVGNPLRMSLQLPGAAQNFNLSTGLGGSYLSDFARGNDTWPFFTGPGSSVLFANNTIIGYYPTIFDLGCYPNNTCGSTPYVFKNNLALGYTTTTGYYPNSGEAPGLYYLSDASVLVSGSYNVEFGIKAGTGDTCGVNGVVCSDPLLVNEPAQGAWPPETVFDEFTSSSNSGFYLASTSSPAYHAGTTGGPGNFSAQCGGGSQTSPATIGACGVSGSTPAATPTFSPVAGSVANPTTVTASTATTGDGCTMYLDTFSPPTTARSTYSVTTAVTLYAQAQGCTDHLNSAIGSAAYVITAPSGGTVISGGVTISGSVVIQ